MIGVTILGATGSIGRSTLDVISRNQDKYKIVALTANKNVVEIFEQCLKYQPAYAVVVDVDCAEQLERKLKTTNCISKVLSGNENLSWVASLNESNYVVAAIVGAAGLGPTMAAVTAGKRILLANKEALVMSGQLFMDEVKKHGAELLPVDSEHNAIFQCIQSSKGIMETLKDVEKIYLTASGGPFRCSTISELEHVTPEQACTHPNWAMGRKISVDSATMMNKGLELIEACWLFDVSVDDIQVVIHPQSIIHSLVGFIDGSFIAQMGQPDMRTPIAHALAWPQRIHSGVETLDLFSVAKLEFEKPDTQRFPCLSLAEQSMREGGTMPVILNAANEVAVAEFLDNRISFTDIAWVVEQALSNSSRQDALDLDVILQADKAARIATKTIIARNLNKDKGITHYV